MAVLHSKRHVNDCVSALGVKYTVRQAMTDQKASREFFGSTQFNSRPSCYLRVATRFAVICAGITSLPSLAKVL
ncbi:MAG: hypothetical protein ABI748_10730 [Dokdonella sp.]